MRGGHIAELFLYRGELSSPPERVELWTSGGKQENPNNLGLFQPCLVGGDWNHGMDYDFPETLGNVIIPSDKLIFFRGVGLNHKPVALLRISPKPTHWLMPRRFWEWWKNQQSRKMFMWNNDGHFYVLGKSCLDGLFGWCLTIVYHDLGEDS